MKKKDYLDELIERNIREDPEFSADWPAYETALELTEPRVTLGNRTLVLSHYQAKEILAAHKTGHPTVRTSLDLNLTRTTLPLTSNGVQINKHEITYEELEKIAKTETTCFRIN